MSGEWVADVRDRLTVSEPHITISVHKSDNPRLAISKQAYLALGSPEYVQIMYSKANGFYRIKLVPCTEHKLNARRICATHKCEYRLSGASNLVRKYAMPKGFYIMDDEKIFSWRHS